VYLVGSVVQRGELTLKRILLVMSISLIFIGSAQLSSGATELISPLGPVAQGEVVQILLTGPDKGSKIEGYWQGQPLEFFKVEEREYKSLLGVDFRMTPGTYPIEVQVVAADNSPSTYRANIEVKEEKFGEQRLTLPQNMVTLDANTLKRVRKEAAKFRKLWSIHTPRRYWYGNFVRPVPGKLSTPFGLGRILNGEPRSPHSGVDLRATLGEPVRAANHGRIVLVGDFFFHGKAVVIDHGWGLYTMYFHLAEVNVSEGDLVGKSYVIGLAGSSGRATGPHLHWGVRLGGARVDPFALMRVTAE
jgi:murein DD-endopeptidase MepM/ murein hydrolase activator NlpD